MAAAQRAQRDLEATQAARAAGNELRRLTSAHQEEFAPATPPVAPDPFSVDAAQLEAEYIASSLKGVSHFDRAGRRAAKAEARRRAAQHLAHVRAEADATRAQWQADLNREWSALLANDPATVFEIVGQALSDNGAWAAPVGVEDSRAFIVMVAPAEASLPGLKPHQKASGAWTTKKLTAAERAALYLEMLASNVLATAKETLAVAPGLQLLSIAVIRNEAPLGAPDWRVLSIAETARQRLGYLAPGASGSAAQLLDHVADIEIRFRANSVKILPLNPNQSGAAAEVLSRLEPDDEDDDVDEGQQFQPPRGGLSGNPPSLTPEVPLATARPEYRVPTGQPVASNATPSVAAGWHPDPSQPGQLRYWDGSTWTAHTAPAQPPPPHRPDDN